MMSLRLFALFFSVFTCGLSSAQSLAGITGQPDTSYTTEKEFQKLKKNYPFISIAEVEASSTVYLKKDLVYGSAGKRKLLLDAFLPASLSKTPQPAIIFIHGGGWRSGNRKQHHALAQKLAALGYPCFTPEYRLSTEAIYPAAIQDLAMAVNWIRTHAREYRIDTSKLVIAGFSAGGELAAYLGNALNEASLRRSPIAAILDLDGTLSFVHPESGEGDDSKKTSAATYWFGFSKKDNYELWKEASPLSHVSPRTPPTLFINSGVARMHAGRDDYIRMLDGLGIYTEVRTFEGSPHSFPLFHPWFDSTVQYIHHFMARVCPARAAAAKVVAQDGSGDFKTVQAALNSIPLNNRNPITIFIKKGIYKEKLHLDSSKNFVTLIGEDKFTTILTYDDHTGKVSPNGDTINTRTSWSFRILADDFTAKNISFQNDAGFSAGQAVAVESNGDRAVFRNCRFIGFQDVLFTNSDKSRQYYEDCYIEGTTDFIFGSSTAWFEHCHIHSKKNSHVTAAATPKDHAFGYVFHDCQLTGDSSVHSASLGRPWRPYAQVSYLHCYIGEHIRTEGWSIWNNNDNHLSSRFYEYKNYGPSAGISSRLSWTRQLSEEEASRYTIKNVLQGWDPQKENR